MQPRKHKSNAERQAAYRARKAGNAIAGNAIPISPPIAPVHPTPIAAPTWKPILQSQRGEIDRIDQPKSNTWQLPNTNTSITAGKTIADFMEK